MHVACRTRLAPGMCAPLMRAAGALHDVVRTAQGIRGGKVVNLKATVDDALGRFDCPSVKVRPAHAVGAPALARRDGPRVLGRAALTADAARAGVQKHRQRQRVP